MGKSSKQHDVVKCEDGEATDRSLTCAYTDCRCEKTSTDNRIMVHCPRCCLSRPEGSFASILWMHEPCAKKYSSKLLKAAGKQRSHLDEQTMYKEGNVDLFLIRYQKNTECGHCGQHGLRLVLTAENEHAPFCHGEPYRVAQRGGAKLCTTAVKAAAPVPKRSVAKPAVGAKKSITPRPNPPRMDSATWSSYTVKHVSNELLDAREESVPLTEAAPPDLKDFELFPSIKNSKAVDAHLVEAGAADATDEAIVEQESANEEKIGDEEIEDTKPSEEALSEKPFYSNSEKAGEERPAEAAPVTEATFWRARYYRHSCEREFIPCFTPCEVRRAQETPEELKPSDVHSQLKGNYMDPNVVPAHIRAVWER